MSVGPADGSVDGARDGVPDGSVDGVRDGFTDGTVDGNVKSIHMPHLLHVSYANIGLLTSGSLRRFTPISPHLSK